MTVSQKFFIAAALVLLSSCDLSTSDNYSVFSISFDFAKADEGWVGDFADYPENDSLAYGLIFKHDTLPANLNSAGNRKALMISGNNQNDDLFMFVRKKISGLKPDTEYELLFNVKFASNAPTGTAAGAPGDSVFLKVGATRVEPVKELITGNYRMNIDKGDLNEEGTDMIVIGHIGVAQNTTNFTELTRNNSSSNSFLITADGSGEIWLILGTDSGYEGTTTLYYTHIDILFNER